MKHTSIWQRLNTALMLLIVLLLAGVGLALWVEEAQLAASQRSDALSDKMGSLKYDVLVMNDALRGQLLDPKTSPETNRWGVAEISFKQTINALDDDPYREDADLTKAVKELRDLVVGPLASFRNQVLVLAQSDPASAVTYYNRNIGAINDQRDQAFAALGIQAAHFKSVEKHRARTIEMIGLACLGVLFVVSLFVARFQSAAVSEPLNRLVATLERMRQGDFTQRLALERKDEFGVLSEGLNRLADDLSALVGQVQRSGLQVNTTATEIAATARQQQGTAHEIAATTAQIGATSKEISATSKELVRTVNEVSQVAEQTGHLANSGQSSIARMETTMRQIMEAAGSITAKLAVLSEKTTNINSVVTTITKVADQTNLLSLNAAIEAEKAGEYGLGFAVVAMEIRRLADQTAVATYDIEKMVKEMQSAVAAGVMGMDKFSEEVRRGTEEVQRVSTHLAQIIHQIQTFTPRFQTVNEGMHAQATGAQQISDTLAQLSESAQQTAESLRQSNQAIEALNGAARGLQTSVARFKLGL
ncbi:MAG TPA: methyl-accepting chemotaxis protein [Candidatus Binatia bacterium]|nr:methyl-accepting chemotaxis protein [Candidatus Binatia bacterium]